MLRIALLGMIAALGCAKDAAPGDATRPPPVVVRAPADATVRSPDAAVRVPDAAVRPPDAAPAPKKKPAPPAAPGRGEACDSGACASGLTCVTYYGVTGPRGPKFTSCETPCKGGAACPAGTSCQLIADGPGQVCR